MYLCRQGVEVSGVMAGHDNCHVTCTRYVGERYLPIVYRPMQGVAWYVRPGYQAAGENPASFHPSIIPCCSFGSDTMRDRISLSCPSNRATASPGVTTFPFKFPFRAMFNNPENGISNGGNRVNHFSLSE